MADTIVVHKGRTNTVTVSLNSDVSLDTFASQIREGKAVTSTLIATWDVEFLTDGSDGELVLTLDDSVTTGITQKKGYMDIKRTTNSEPVSVFDSPLAVSFRDVVTE